MERLDRSTMRNMLALVSRVFSLSRRGSVIDARKSSSTLDPPGHCALNCQGTFRN